MTAFDLFGANEEERLNWRQWSSTTLIKIKHTAMIRRRRQKSDITICNCAEIPSLALARRRSGGSLFLRCDRRQTAPSQHRFAWRPLRCTGDEGGRAFAGLMSLGMWTASAIVVISEACRDNEDVAETSPKTPKASQSEKSSTQLYRRVQIGPTKTQFQSELYLGRHGPQIRCAGSAG